MSKKVKIFKSNLDGMDFLDALDAAGDNPKAIMAALNGESQPVIKKPKNDDLNRIFPKAPNKSEKKVKSLDDSKPTNAPRVMEIIKSDSDVNVLTEAEAEPISVEDVEKDQKISKQRFDQKVKEIKEEADTETFIPNLTDDVDEISIKIDCDNYSDIGKVIFKDPMFSSVIDLNYCKDMDVSFYIDDHILGMDDEGFSEAESVIWELFLLSRHPSVIYTKDEWNKFISNLSYSLNASINTFKMYSKEEFMFSTVGNYVLGYRIDSDSVTKFNEILQSIFPDDMDRVKRLITIIKSLVLEIGAACKITDESYIKKLYNNYYNINSSNTKVFENLLITHLRCTDTAISMSDEDEEDTIYEDITKLQNATFTYNDRLEIVAWYSEEDEEEDDSDNIVEELNEPLDLGEDDLEDIDDDEVEEVEVEELETDDDSIMDILSEGVETVDDDDILKVPK